ncbi:MAG: hypothetical protein ACRCV0_01875 [Brevinema sp.]
MRIYLLLITVLILGACADKQTLSQTKSENQANSKSLIFDPSTGSTKILDDEITNKVIEEIKIEPNTIVSEEYKQKMDELQAQNPDAIIARYDKGLDLILLVSTFKIWYIYQMYSKQDPDEWIGYSAKYWDKTQNYYAVFSMEKTNDILYIIDSELDQESIVDNKLRELYLVSENETPYNLNEIYHKSSELRYVGSISPLERIYIDISNNNIQYIKKLEVVKNVHVTKEILDSGTYPFYNIIEHPLKSPVYPIYPYPYDIVPISDEGFLSSPVIVTNKEGEWFDLSVTTFLLLDIEKTKK